MTAAPTIILGGDRSRHQAGAWVKHAALGTVVTFNKPRRSISQNARLHAMLTDVARQAEWPLGSGIKRTVEAWKDIFTAALRSANHGLDVVPGINGGFVLLGMHTSQMTVAEAGDLMELISAWCAENGVTLSEGVAA